MTTTKTCSKCGETKPATTEFFPSKNARLRGYCKACDAARSREYNRRWPEWNRRTSREHAARKAAFKKVIRRRLGYAATIGL